MPKIILYKVPGKKAKYMSPNVVPSTRSMTVAPTTTLPESLRNLRELSPMQLMQMGYIEIVKCGLMTKYMPTRQYQELFKPTFQPPTMVITQQGVHPSLSPQVFALLEAYMEEK